MKNEEKAKNFFNKLRADCMKIYLEKIQKVFNQLKSNLNETDLEKQHEEAKNVAVQLVCFIAF